MKTKLLLLTVLTATTLTAAPKKLLVVTVTTGFRHSSIPTSEKVIADLAKSSGAFTVDFVSQPEGSPGKLKKDASGEEKAAHKAATTQWEKTKLKPALAKLSPAALKNYDAVAFVSTTGNLPVPDLGGLLDWIKAGGGFVGIHAASDTFHGSPEFIAMLGGEFKTHGPQVGVECLNHDPKHPATAHLGKTWTIPLEEIYEFKNYDTTKVSDLLTLAKHPQQKTPGHFPVSWHKPFGQGRVFYTSLGHREDIWDTDFKDRKNPEAVAQDFQQHVLGGIKWALKLAD